MTETITHAPTPNPYPAPPPRGPDPLAPLGLRLDHRTVCQPWGSHMPGGRGMRVYTVVADGNWERVTCKACLR